MSVPTSKGPRRQFTVRRTSLSSQFLAVGFLVMSLLVQSLGWATGAVAASPTAIPQPSPKAQPRAGAAYQVAAVGGQGQWAKIGTTFDSPLRVLVTDINGQGVPNASVTLTAPDSGPGATFFMTGNYIYIDTDQNGYATSRAFIANYNSGSYNITATVSGIASYATFNETNVTNVSTFTVGDGTPASCTDAAIRQYTNNYQLLNLNFNCGPNPVTISLDSPLAVYAAGNLTLDGGTPGLITLSGNNTHRIFNLDFAQSLYLKNMTLYSGNAIVPGQPANTGFGGAIINFAGYISLTNSTVYSSTAYNGGGIYNGEYSYTYTDPQGRQYTQWYCGKVDVDSSTFYSNTAALTSDFYQGEGGAIANTTGCPIKVVNNSRLYNNSSFDGGGIFNFGASANTGIGSVTIQNSNIYNNASIYSSNANNNYYVQATGIGGGIFNQNPGKLYIDQANIYGNNSDSNGAGLYSGGVLILNNSSVHNNTSSGSGGGGIYTGSSELSLISNSQIYGNQASGTNDYASPNIGGGIENDGLLTITNTQIYNNQATYGGGGIYSTKQLTVTSSTIYSNTVTRYFAEGGSISAGGLINLSNDSIFANTAPSSGGGIYIYSYNDPTQANFNNIQIYGNTSSNNGGGVVIDRNIPVTISNSNIYSNTAVGSGGAISNGGNLTLFNSNVYSNTANTNSSDGGGAGLYASATSGPTNVIGSSFYNNLATPGNNGHASRGGAIYADQGSTPVSITNSSFYHNSADLGGAVFSNQAMVISGTTIYSNMAIEGGAVLSLGGGGQITVSNSTLTGNSATDAGGGFFVDWNATGNLVNTTLANNTATKKGNNVFNQRYDNGYGVYVGTLNITNTILTQNVGNSISNCEQPGPINDGGNNLEYPGNPTNNSCGFLTAKNDRFGDPKLGQLANNGGPTLTMALQNGSFAIDGGNDTVCAATPVNAVDQIGTARPVGAHCDIGAFEYNAPTVNVAQLSGVGGTVQNTFQNTVFGKHFKALATDNSGNPLPNVIVTFTAPSNGASGTFANGSTIESDTTDSNGIATATIFTANNTAGTYTVVASAAYVTSTAPFSLGNIIGGNDSDGDGLPDAWETHGITVTTSSGVQFVDLPAMGADPNKKDLFLQIDWMQDSTHNTKLDPAALKIVVDAFAAHNINLHIDQGPDSILNYATGATWGSLSRAKALPFVSSLGQNIPGTKSYNWTAFQQLKNSNFSLSGRNSIFHYTISANTYNNSDSSGISRNGSTVSGGASDLIVSLGTTYWTFKNTSSKINAQAGTLMHEFGHNLGLGHGGGDDLNYKPNYLSVMNYSYQLNGLYKNGKYGYFDYSESQLTSLDETNLNENIGLGAGVTGYGLIYTCGKNAFLAPDATKPIDLNCDGRYQSGISYDINSDNLLTVLQGYNDWANLKFTGGSIGSFGVELPTDSVTEETVTPDTLNMLPQPAGSITANLGSGQTVLVGQPFTVPFQVIIKDSSGNVMANKIAIFTAPTSGAGGTFTGGSSSITVTTDASGLATTPTFTANNVAGVYQVVASVDNNTFTAAFNLTNDATTPIPPASSGYTYYLPFLAQGALGYTSYLAFQNVGTSAANLSLSYYNPQGTLLTTDATCTSLAALAECLPSNPFTTGNSGVGVIVSSQPLNVIVAEGTPFGGSAYAVSAGSTNNLVAPFIFKNAYGDFNTQLTIFNGGTTPVVASVNFYDQHGNLQTGATKNVTIQPYSSQLLDQALSSSNLPNGFQGWAQISSPTGSKLVAQVLEQSASQKFVAIANASSGPHNTLFAPAIFKGAFGFNTGANIVNPNNTAVNVTVTYYDGSGNPVTTAPFQLAANSVQAIYQGGNGGPSGLPAGNGLAAGFSGAAIVTSDGPGVVMVVNESGGISASGTSLSGVYAASANGSNSVGLPVMASGGFGYTTGATIFNTSNQPTSGTIQYYDVSGKPVGNAQPFSIGAHASQLAYQGAAGLLPANFYGTAIISQTSGGGSSGLIVTTNALSGLFYTYTEPNQ